MSYDPRPHTCNRPAEPFNHEPTTCNSNIVHLKGSEVFGVSGVAAAFSPRSSGTYGRMASNDRYPIT